MVPADSRSSLFIRPSERLHSYGDEPRITWDRQPQCRPGRDLGSDKRSRRSCGGRFVLTPFRPPTTLTRSGSTTIIQCTGSAASGKLTIPHELLQTLPPSTTGGIELGNSSSDDSRPPLMQVTTRDGAAVPVPFSYLSSQGIFVEVKP